ncbi:MAG: hypothetical protein EXS52_00620 [Candidatus Staskawiczbacteria bacterium]|nr:hypothetical protein [Candidatus Staskawiczbacteria bacterium]
MTAENPLENSNEEVVEGVELTEQENLQYEALQKVESFDDLYKYIDAYSPEDLVDHIKRYKAIDITAASYEHGSILTKAIDIRSTVKYTIQTPEYRDGIMARLPGEIHAKVKYLLEKEGK